MRTCISTNGAATNQPRAERSAALGFAAVRTAEPCKGGTRLVVLPLQGFPDKGSLTPGRRFALPWAGLLRTFGANTKGATSERAWDGRVDPLLARPANMISVLMNFDIGTAFGVFNGFRRNSKRPKSRTYRQGHWLDVRRRVRREASRRRGGGEIGL